MSSRFRSTVTPRHTYPYFSGLDTAKGDPTGSFTLGAQDFRENGRRLGLLGLPILVVQEGGYKTRSLGANARHFFAGLCEGLTLSAASSRQHPRAAAPKP
jgi:acetoin utilization deacetylase AcuC-like enzyme